MKRIPNPPRKGEVVRRKTPLQPPPRQSAAASPVRRKRNVPQKQPKRRRAAAGRKLPSPLKFHRPLREERRTPPRAARICSLPLTSVLAASSASSPPRKRTAASRFSIPSGRSIRPAPCSMVKFTTCRRSPPSSATSRKRWKRRLVRCAAAPSPPRGAPFTR